MNFQGRTDLLLKLLLLILWLKLLWWLLKLLLLPMKLLLLLLEWRIPELLLLRRVLLHGPPTAQAGAGHTHAVVAHAQVREVARVAAAGGLLRGGGGRGAQQVHVAEEVC